jgi:hypothetical protein
MNRDLTGPDRHRSPLDPPRLRTGPPWPESADPFRPGPTATPAPTTRALTSACESKRNSDPRTQPRADRWSANRLRSP